MTASHLLIATLLPATYPPPPDEMPPLRVAELPSTTPTESRLLLSFGLLAGGGENQLIGQIDPFGTQVGPESIVGLGLGLYFRIGVQLDDHWGFGPEVGAGTSLYFNFARLAFTVDYTPFDWLTLALGPSAWIDPELATACPAFGCGTTTAEAAGGTVRVDFHLGASRNASGARSGLTLGLVGDAGATLGANAAGRITPGFAWGLYLEAGYSLY